MAHRINIAFNEVLEDLGDANSPHKFAQTSSLAYSTVNQWKTGSDIKVANLREFVEALEDLKKGAGLKLLAIAFGREVKETCSRGVFLVGRPDLAIKEVVSARGMVMARICEQEPRMKSQQLSGWANGVNHPLLDSLILLANAMDKTDLGAGQDLLSYVCGYDVGLVKIVAKAHA